MMELVWQKVESIGRTYTGPAAKGTIEMEILAGYSDSETFNQISNVVKTKCDEEGIVLLSTKIYFVENTVLGKYYYVYMETIGSPTAGLEFVLTTSMIIIIAAAIVLAIAAVLFAYYVHESLVEFGYVAGPTSPLLVGAIAVVLLALSAGYIYNKFLKEPKKLYVPEIKGPERSMEGVDSITW